MAPAHATGGRRGPSFGILALADFSGQGKADTTQPKVARKAEFDQLFARFSPRLSFQGADYLGSGKAKLPIELAFSGMADFLPLSILTRSPSLNGYVITCRALAGVARGEVGLDAARSQLRGAELPDSLRDRVTTALAGASATAAPNPPAAAGGEGDILSQVAMPDAKKPAQAHVQSLLDHLKIPRVQLAQDATRRGAAALLEDVCQRLHRQLDEILHHDSFRSLEAAWRGLQFLVTRSNQTDVPLTIHAAHAAREDAPRVLAENLERLDRAATPANLAILGFAFDASSGDVAILKELSATGERFYCQVVAGAAPALLGVTDERLPASFQQRFDAPELLELKEFRTTPNASYMALATPDLAGRSLYGPKTVPVADIAYVEGESPLWMNPAWAVGAAITGSLERTGWPIAISGPESGRVSELPVVPIQSAGTTVHTCVRYVFTDEQRTVLGGNALVALQGRPNSTYATIMSVPTLFEAPPGADAAERREMALHASLPYRLFANAVAVALSSIQGSLVGSLSDQEIHRAVAEGLGGMFNDARCVQVGISPHPSGGRQVSLEIAPDFAILGRPAELTLSLNV